MGQRGAEGLVRTAALASLVMAVAATAGCVTSIDCSSHMFGGGLRSPHINSWVTYSQETQWKNKGDITKVNLYYDAQTKCLRGVKATFGYNSSDARRIGVEGSPAGPYSSADLKLTPSQQNTEQIVKADYKFSDTCVEYLKLYTNRNRVTAIGNSDSSSPLLTTWPVAPNGYLGFFKGWTDEANTGAQVGKLTQLQLVWVVRTCNDTPTYPNPSAPPSYPNPSAPPPTPTPPPPPVNVTPKCTPAAKLGCNAGKCPASTCPLTGLGLAVPMLCYGVNTEFLPLQNYLHPCTNLACQLDKPGCQSFGVLGIGSYCTGTVAAMADASKLHPIAKLLVGYPCIEHTGPILDVVPAFSSAQNKGVYMAKAWKTCDCMQGASTIIQAMISKNASLSAAVDIKVGEMGALLTKVFNVSLPNCKLEDMLEQWISAIAIKLPLPKLVVPELKVVALGALIPGFKLPCLVLPDISVPLLKIPLALKALPIFQIQASKVVAIAKLLEVTTLPTLLLPSSGATDVMAIAQSVTLPDLSIDVLKALAATFVANGTQDFGVNGLMNLLSLDKMANISMLLQPSVAVTKLDLPAMIGQWAAANTLNISLPTLLLGEPKLSALKVLIPGLKFPCMIVPQAAAAFVLAHKTLPLFVVSEAVINGVSQLLPGMTSLATVLVDKSVQTNTPTIKIGEVTIPNFTKLALQLSASLLPNVTIPSLPAMPSLLNIQSVNLNGLANFFDNMEKTFKIVTAGGSAAVKQLESTLGEVASAVIPDSVEATFANFATSAAGAMQQLQSALGQAVSAVLPDSIEAMFSSVNATGPTST